jgi:NAD-dependent DNA ligase
LKKEKVMEENIEEFYDFAYTTEFDKNFDLAIWTETDVKGFLKLDTDQFNYLIERTGKQAKSFRWKKSYNVNIYEEMGETCLTTIGLYLFLKLNAGLKKYDYFKKYINYFQDLALDDLIRYNGLKATSKKTKKRTNSSYDFEKQGEYNSKIISKDLKKPNLDIEDKSHIFYNKKVLITGKFEKFDDRDEMSALIKSVGGLNKSSISKSLDYVIVGSEAGPAKLKVIEENSIKTFNEQEFIELFKK